MNWINTFELLCYILCASLLASIAYRRSIFEAKLFASGAIAGYTLELLAVRVTDIYHYSTLFWLSFGFVPYQFPAFGGLMWGGLTVCAVRIARRLGLNRTMTALVAGFLVVSMDLFLDVAAIRLEGGFWTWEGRPISADVTHHLFMSVIWVNFLGYLFETPMVVWLALRDEERRTDRSLAQHVLAVILNALGGILFVGVASVAALWLDSITDEWFSCVAFLLLWVFILAQIIQCVRKGKPSEAVIRPEFMAVTFFFALYAYCLCGLWSLAIFETHLWLLVGWCALLTLTVILGLATPPLPHQLQSHTN